MGRSEGDNPTRWNLAGLGAHRPSQGRDRRRPHRLGGRKQESRITSRMAISTTCSSGVHEPVVAQLQVVSVASFRWLGGRYPRHRGKRRSFRLQLVPTPFPRLWSTNAQARIRPITDAIARKTAPERGRVALDVAGLLRDRPGDDSASSGRRPPRCQRPPLLPGERQQLGVRCCAAVPSRELLDAGVRILEYPTMLHAKAFVADGEVVRRDVQP